jgi:hypothetical protein
MHMSRKLVIGVVAAAAAAVGIGTAASAAGGSTTAVAAPYRPISPDAPFDSQLQNVTCAVWPTSAPPAGTVYAHLPRWANGAGGTVILREDKVDVHRADGSQWCYTNTNPLIRNYTLDPHVVIRVYQPNYIRMTGRTVPGYVLRQVSRQQFLNSYNPKDEYQRYLRYATVYRLGLDRTGTRIVRIDEVNINWRYGTCGC